MRRKSTRCDKFQMSDFVDKVAARRVRALFNEINDIICPTGCKTPIDFIRKNRGLSNLLEPLR